MRTFFGILVTLLVIVGVALYVVTLPEPLADLSTPSPVR